MPEQPFDPEDPPRIGQYEVLSRLGRGGMATVYLGRGTSGRWRDDKAPTDATTVSEVVQMFRTARRTPTGA